MKLQALTALCSVALVNAHALSGERTGVFGKHAHIARQQPADPNGIPPLSSISASMPTGTTYAASQTFAPGTKPTAVPNAPAIPQCQYRSCGCFEKEKKAHGLCLQSL